MNSKFISTLGFVLAVNLIVKPLWIFGIDRNVQNRVGAESYGFYISMYSLSLFFSFILDMGIANFNTRFLAQNNRILQKYLKYFLSMKLMLAAAYVTLTLLLAVVLHYNIQQLSLLFLLLLNQIFLSQIIFFRSVASGLHFFKSDALISVTDRLLLIVICSVLLWAFPAQVFMIEWYIYSQTLVYFVTMLISGWFVASMKINIRIRFRKTFLYALIKQTWPFALLALLMTLYNRSDMVLLERLLPDGAVQSGIYAQAFRIFEAFSMIALLFAGILLPMFARMLHAGQRTDTLVKLSSGIILFMALFVAVVSVMYAPEIVALLYTSHQAQSVEVFRLIMPACLGISATYIFGTLLTANGNLKYLNIMAGVAVLLSVVLNLIFIPMYQAAGAAAVALVIQSLTGLVQIVLAARILRIRFGWLLFMRLILFVSLVFISAWGLKFAAIPWLSGIVFLGLLSVLLLFITRLLSICALRIFMQEMLTRFQTAH